MGMSWASHPNAELRERVAAYLGRGYLVRWVDESSVVVWRRSRLSRLASLIMNPGEMLTFRWRGPDQLRIVVDPAGGVTELIM